MTLLQNLTHFTFGGELQGFDSYNAVLERLYRHNGETLGNNSYNDDTALQCGYEWYAFRAHGGLLRFGGGDINDLL
jgi:hypothetical protein